MIFIKDRIRKLLSVLGESRYPKTEPVDDFRMLKTEEPFEDISTLDYTDWEPLGGHLVWGGHMEYYWFMTDIVIPEEFDGECVLFRLRTGKEGEWDATNPQFACFVNGKLRQGMDVNHTEAILTECAGAGSSYRILLRAFTGNNNFNLKLEADICVLDRRTERYYYDLLAPFEAAKLLEEGDTNAIRMLSLINESLNLIDLREIHSEQYYASLQKAQEFITEQFYHKYCGGSDVDVYCVGHTHIDCAWLWTLPVTADKAVRSFSTVLKLMEEYPEYTFMSSQPLLYQFVKEHAPQVYEEIRKRVSEGRWETEGGMYVEADCNLASGEALIRQFIYGKRFFREEFGTDNHVLWLPDVFGYSAALPQIMKKCGIDYFMTTKISWNEINKMPYDTFRWEGIDGTRVLTHFVPTQAYRRHIPEGSFAQPHNTTYCGMVDASHLLGGWDRYSQKDLNSEILNCFGYGDGGGGPTREMLEKEQRYALGIPGCPRAVPGSVNTFFNTLREKVTGNRLLPLWVGELYLEYHRGTYTSMARNKRYNRRAEFALVNQEFYSTLNFLYNHTEFPKQKLRNLWGVLLKNQFHDILPGSSIFEVYEDSREEYENLFRETDELLGSTLSSLSEQINAPKGSIIVFNPNGMMGSGIVELDGKALFYAKDIPSKGYKVFTQDAAESSIINSGRDNRSGDNSSITISASAMENDFVRLTFAPNGQFSSIYDKQSGRELLKPGQNGNVLMTYEDRPHNFDAWDLNNYYTEKSWEVSGLTSIEVTEEGPVRACVRVIRPYLKSVITQDICIYADTPRIDIKTVIDWKEEHIFLKALFPVDIHTDEATFEIQYGNVARKTHSNTMWDFARFEVCMHKWLDVSEDGFGAAFLMTANTAAASVTVSWASRY